MFRLYEVMNEPEDNIPKDAPTEKTPAEIEREKFKYYDDDATGYEIYDSTADDREEDTCDNASSESGKP